MTEEEDTILATVRRLLNEAQLSAGSFVPFDFRSPDEHRNRFIIAKLGEALELLLKLRMRSVS